MGEIDSFKWILIKLLKVLGEKCSVSKRGVKILTRIVKDLDHDT